MTEQTLVPLENIAATILTIRGQRVILDSDLARLYGVTTKQFNQAVKRNRERFPPDFMFTLTKAELTELVTNCDRFARLKHSSALPYAFTEHGAVMAASILSTPKAVEVSKNQKGRRGEKGKGRPHVAPRRPIGFRGGEGDEG